MSDFGKYVNRLPATMPGEQARAISDIARDILKDIEPSENKLAKTVYVTDYGAKGDGTTDDTAAIQACIDANPEHSIVFPHGSYVCSSTIILVDANGRDFQGRLIGQAATITFTNSGTSTDTDIEMQRGFACYAKQLSAGGDVSGMQGTSFHDLKIVGPTNGACLYIANSIDVKISACKFLTGRYGLVMECCIDPRIENCNFDDFTNAGIGLLFLEDTDRVWYGSSVNPEASSFNDGVLISGCTFGNAQNNATLTHILDHGSAALRTRTIIANRFFSRWDGSGSFSSTQYGYLGRRVEPTFIRNWFENVTYPIRILNSDSAEGGGNITAVSGAQPDGTYAMSNIADGFSYNTVIQGNHFAKAFTDINVSGVTGGSCFIGQNLSQQLRDGGVHISSNQTGSTMIVDAGDTLISTPTTYSYKSLSGYPYIDLSAQWTDYTPTLTPVTGSITSITVNSARYLRRGRDVLIHADITITNNGTGAGAYISMSLPFSATTNGGALCGRETGVSGVGILANVAGTTADISRYDNTYPGGTNYRLVVAGLYEAA